MKKLTFCSITAIFHRTLWNHHSTIRPQTSSRILEQIGIYIHCSQGETKDYEKNTPTLTNWILISNEQTKLQSNLRLWSFDKFLLSHVIYLKLTRELQECLLSKSFNIWMINYSYTQKSYLAIWQNCFGHFITQKFVSLKSNHFSQFFWW